LSLLRRRHASIALALAAFALGALLPAAFGRTAAEPTAVREALARSASVEGAPGRTMVLSKVVVQPGAKLAVHHHLGTQISRVASGTLTYTVRRGSATLRSGDAEADPKLVRRIRAGQTASVRPGQWLVEQPSDIHEAANRGSAPVVIYLATLLQDGAPPATPVELPPASSRPAEPQPAP
jgi:mannose-6-phosphate isomerase-like protein (cupin superfamily)